MPWKDFKFEFYKIKEYDTAKIIIPDGIGFSYMGSGCATGFFPGFWSARSKAQSSPKQLFENDAYLSEMIRGIILKGRFPSKKALLNALRHFKGNKVISSFMPCMAKAIYQKYATPTSRVIDFCGGYGGRMLGAAASPNVSSYTAIEPCSSSFQGLSNLARELATIGVDKPLAVANQDAVTALKQFEDKEFDFCFTSPPYFNAEEYDDAQSQSRVRFPYYGSWLEGFLFPSITEACRVSKRVVINIANTGSYPIADELRRWASERKILVEEGKLWYPKRGGGKKYEPLFVMEDAPPS
jgi:hypothetical protein